MENTDEPVDGKRPLTFADLHRIVDEGKPIPPPAFTPPDIKIPPTDPAELQVQTNTNTMDLPSNTVEISETEEGGNLRIVVVLVLAGVAVVFATTAIVIFLSLIHI